jgi:ABC-type sugar transport system ATPase subunit
MSMPLLSLENIDKSYGATTALRGVSLDLHAGEVHCLIGENGAGKSTLGKIIGGTVRQDFGLMKINGTAISLHSLADARRAGISMVFQELSLAPDLSVQDNICLGIEPTRNPFRLVRRSPERVACEAIFRTIGMEKMDVRRLAGSLPPAHQQLAEIAKALATAPRILILDEPTAMLSVADRTRLHTVMRQLCAAGTAIVFVTHHVAEVAETADRVTVLRNGAVVGSISGRATVPQIAACLGGTIAGPDHRHAGSKDATRSTVLELSVPSLQRGVERVCLAEGEIVSLYGVVGCGREVIARSITGHEHGKNTFDLQFNGKRLAVKTPAHARRSGIGHLPAGRAANGILPSRSIQENLYLRPRTKEQPLAFFANRGVATTELRDLGVRYGSVQDKITSLSGGNQQKVLIGRLLDSGLRLLVLEEPTAGIDIAAKADIHALLRRRVDDGLAILLISSDLEETISLSDRVHTMFAGKLARTFVAPVPEDAAIISADVIGASLITHSGESDGKA